MKHKFYLLLAAFLMVCSWGAGAQIISTVAGDSTIGYCCDDSLATEAELYAPIFVALDGLGNFYFSDSYNFRIRKVNTAGIITTIAGTGIQGFSGDGGPATDAKVYYPSGLRFDKNDNLYFADNFNDRIRKIDTAGIITTIAGPGVSGISGDGGPATAGNLFSPHDLALDESGNIYITDCGNYCVRKVAKATGIITTVAGTFGVAGFSGDGGPATNAKMGELYGIAVDGPGNIFIADYSENRIRMVDTSGVVSTIAGTGINGYNGDNIAATSAELNGPAGVAVDIDGGLLVADGYNGRVRKIQNAINAGIITTIVGDGSLSYSGDGGLATLAGIDETGITLDYSGDIYIADYSHGRIRYVKNTLSTNSLDNIINNINIYPNPDNGFFTVNIPSNIDEEVNIVIVNEIGERIKRQSQ